MNATNLPWSQFPLLRGLSTEALETLRQMGTTHRYGPGETLLRRGEQSATVHLILEGLVAVQVDTPQGERRTLVNLGPGQALGEIALVDGGPHSADVVALAPTRTFSLSHTAFWAFCEEHPQHGVQLLRNLAADLAFKLRHANLSQI